MTEKDHQFYKAFGIRLARARRRSKLKQETLAIAVGLSRTSITNIERGRQPVQLHLATELAKILNVNVTMLLPDAVVTPEVPSRAQLDTMDATKRRWVERILTRKLTIDPGEHDDGTVQPRKEESRRVTQGKKD
jgi:DNA-binding XRE family transcriptional regulator